VTGKFRRSGSAAAGGRDVTGFAAIGAIVLAVGGEANVFLPLAIAAVTIAFALVFGFVAGRTTGFDHGRLPLSL
jgi:hypothetical protein